MSYVTYSPNELVYIRDIGYATLLNCGARNSISQKIDAPPSKKQSIYFDPDLFNSDGDSNHSKKSKSDDEKIEKIQKKLIEVIKDKPNDQQTNTNPVQKVEEKAAAEVINIITARLQGGTGVIYTSDRNITKSIIVVVKSFLIRKKQQIIVEIQISKTIDTLKKQIFTQIGQQISQYYNVKLYALTPTMNELNVPSKTISQSQIRDNSKLILTADYAFSFRPITLPKNSKYKKTLTNNTIVSSKIVDEPKKAQEKTPIALPPPQSPSENVENKAQQKKVEQKTENKAQQTAQKREEAKINQVKKQNTEIVGQQKVQIGPYNAKCTVEFASGSHYWEIKVEKLPIDQQDLVIGVCVESNHKQTTGIWCCSYAWAYQIISGKKVFVERIQETNTYQQEVESYGYAIRQNDTIGVLLQFKGKRASLTFYKNFISCGQAFSIDLQNLRDHIQLVPFVNVGGECQISLDSKALPPIDSYRWK